MIRREVWWVVVSLEVRAFMLRQQLGLEEDDQTQRYAMIARTTSLPGLVTLVSRWLTPLTGYVKRM